MKKTKKKKRDLKKITRTTTFAVIVFSLAILAATGWFIVKSLNETAAAKVGDKKKTFKVQGVNSIMLEKVQTFATDRESPSRRLGSLPRNPFAEPAPPPPPPPPPEATPAPTTTPPSSPPASPQPPHSP